MLRAAASLLVAVTIAGCGGNEPPSTSPMATTGVVGGTVETSIVRGAEVPSILVSIGGTPLTANVSRLGDFVIANVPAGPLELRFTGEGIAAVLPAGEMAGGETVTLAVRLMAAEAAIESMSRIRGSAALVEGAIETSSLALPEGTIIVGGRTIIVPAGTAITGAASGATAASLKPGVRVRITGTASATGVTAQQITIR